MRISRRTRNLVLLGAGAAIAGSLLAFFATGMHPYTRFRDRDLEQANAESSLSDLFNDAGAEVAPTPRVESANAIGFLPSGPGLASLSVVTVSGPALVAMLGVVILAKRSSCALQSQHESSGGHP